MSSARGGRSAIADGAFWLAFLVVGDASAQEPPTDEAPAPRLLRDPIEGTRGEDTPISERRDVPDYDGRPDAKPSPGERALWAPRILLSPLYVTNEYIVRRPMRAFALWGEKNHVGTRVANAFTFGTGGRVGVLPTALFDFGLRSSVGLYLFATDVPSDGDRFGVHLAYGGADWWRASVTERIHLRGDRDAQNTEWAASRLSFRFVFDQRPDHLLAGVGTQEHEFVGAFKWTRLGGEVEMEWVFGALDSFSLRLDASRNRFGNGSGDIDQADGAILDRFAAAEDPEASLRSIPGFDGYERVGVGASVVLDSRDPDPVAPGSGARGRVDVDLASDAGDGERIWLVTAGELGLFADLNRRRRVVSLSHRVQLGEALGDAPIPVPERPLLGGANGMRGFAEGRIRGESTWLTTMQYTYPIWAYLDGFAFYEVGNGFGPRLEGLAADALASSFGVGIQSNANRDAAFALSVGAGTTPFGADGFGVSSVRIQLGTTRGF